MNFKEIKLPWLLKKGLSVMLIRVIGMAIVYLSILYITNVYGAETYGRYTLAQTLVQALILLFSLGIRTSIVKLTSDVNFFLNGKPLNNYLKKIVFALLASSIICAILLLIFKNWLAIEVFKDHLLADYFKYTAVFIVFVIFHSVLAEFIRAKKKFWEYSLYVYVLPPLLFFITLIAIRSKGLPESSIILSYLLSFVVICVILLFYFPFNQINVKTDYSYKKLFSLSLPMMFSALFLFLSNWTDVFMLGILSTKTDVGVYNAAFKLAIIAFIVINAINTVFAPKISELFSQNKLKEIEVEFHKARRMTIYLTLPIIIIIIAFRKQLLSLFGDDFVYGETALTIIVCGLLINVFSGSVDYFLNMTNHQKPLRTFTIISAVINIVLNYFLIKEMGINGAAIASVISSLTINLLCVFYIKKQFGFYTFFQLKK